MSRQPSQQLTACETTGLIRLSVGLESIDDLLADLETGFAAAK
jgi:O-acetylhomoserine (thiol)-lyase